MPLDGGKYRVTTTPKGAKIRLHFTKGGTVNEAKNLDSGATHTPQEFAADRKKKGAKLRAAMLGGSSTTRDRMR
jgi:hypothetical protein